MKHGTALALATACLLTTTAAHAERLDIDHRLYPPLHEAMEHPDEATVYYDASKRGRVFDRILVRGTSAQRDWTEALELLVAPRDAALASPEAWFRSFQPSAETKCPGTISVLGQDEASLTFSLEAPACHGAPALSGLYRVVYGRKAVYLVGAKQKGAMAPDQRQQWLALLASARLAG